MNGIPLLLLFIYSGLTINLVLQCALGIKGIAEAKKTIDLSIVIKSVIIFFSIILLWFFFSRVLYSIITGIFVYVLIFPLSALLYDGLEYLVFKYVLKKDAQKESSIVSLPGALQPLLYLYS